MTATDILQVLKKGNPLTMAEISTYVECSLQSLYNSMNRLKKDKSENIQFRKLTQEEKMKKYGKKIPASVLIYWLGPAEMTQQGRQ